MLEVGKQLIFYAPIAHLTLKGTPMGVKQVTLLIQSLLLMSYGHTVHLTHLMNFISVNRFRDNLKLFIEQVVNDHAPIKVTRRAGEDFLVMSADDWKREQETLHVLQYSSLCSKSQILLAPTVRLPGTNLSTSS